VQKFLEVWDTSRHDPLNFIGGKKMNIREAFEEGTIAFNAHDIDRFANLMTDDVEFRAPGVSGRGKVACAAFYKTWLDAFPDGHVDVRKAELSEGFAVEEGSFSGTHKGVLKSPSGDIPATGRSVEVDYIQVIRFHGDKHASFNLSFDRLQLLEQLGLMQTAPA
jgi:predicted ester cyclase